MTKHTLNTLQCPLTPPKQPLNAPPITQKALKLSRKGNECKPLPATTHSTRLAPTLQGLTLVPFSDQRELLFWDTLGA
jgi:hypothetical protein